MQEGQRRVAGPAVERPGDLLCALAWPRSPQAPSPMLQPWTGGRSLNAASPAPHAWPQADRGFCSPGNHTKKTVPVKAQAQPVQLTDLYPGMTYTLRVYSRDNEGVSSTIITFMTSAGERGPGPATPTSMGHFILILSFLLVSSQKEDPSPPMPHLAWRVSALTLCGSRGDEEPEVHAQWRGNHTSDPAGTSGGIRGKQGYRTRTRRPPGPAPPQTQDRRAWSLRVGLGAAGVAMSLPREHWAWLPACRMRE